MNHPNIVAYNQAWLEPNFENDKWESDNEEDEFDGSTTSSEPNSQPEQFQMDDVSFHGLEQPRIPEIQFESLNPSYYEEEEELESECSDLDIYVKKPGLNTVK